MNTPKIRFKGFTDDWEQRKLGTLCSLITKGTTPKDKSGNGEVNFIKVENINPDNGEIIVLSKISTEEHERYLKRSKLEEDDILFSIAGTLGRVSVVKSNVLPANTNQAIAIIRVKEGYIPYLTTVLKGPAVEDFIRKNPTIGAQPNLSLEQVNNLDISYPKYEEQVKIGEYFKSLDDLITLHQRKCDETKELKKYMLQKMFPKNGEKNPEIRFEGFTDDWEQRKLIDYLDVSNEKNKKGDYKKTDVLSVSGEVGIVNQIEFQGRSFAGVSVENYGIVNEGDVVYTKSPLKANPYGIIKTNKGKAGIVSTLYAVYKPKENTDSDFVQIYFELDSRMNSYMHPLVNKGAKNDMKVSDENALKGTVTFPKINEQKAISNFITELDHLITLHQRKCEKLKELKKFMLQNMFV